MLEYKTRVGEGGRVVVPAELRRAIGVEPGDDVVLVLDESGVRILTSAQAIDRAQSLVRQHLGEQSGLVDELIRERRAEARRE